MPFWLSDPWLTDWLHLLTRWFHLIVGAGWIGASFYFNWLNNNVRPVDDPTGRLAGGLWAVHGGAYYEVKKYKGAPEKLPETLHWFKWLVEVPSFVSNDDAPMSTGFRRRIGQASYLSCSK